MKEGLTEMLSARVEQRGASLSAASLITFIQQTLTIVEVEVRKLRHDPFELLTRTAQPALWLLVFGQVFAKIREVPTGGLRYLDFMAPGILAQSVLFIAIFYGISVIWERDLGILQKFLVSPASRTALVLGKAISAGVRGLSMTVIVYVLILLLGVQVKFSPWDMVGVAFGVVLGSAIFSTLSLLLACLVKTRERFMGMGQLMTMPLFFASNAIYPIAMMPDWLKVIAAVNPLSYQVDALRSLMVQGGQSVFGLGVDFGVEILILIVLLTIATKVYPSLVN